MEVLIGLVIFAFVTNYILLNIFKDKLNDIHTRFEHKADTFQDRIRELELKLSMTERELFRQREEIKHHIIDKLDEMTNKKLKDYKIKEL